MLAKNFYPSIFIFLIFTFFCLGFYLDENSAGAGGYSGDLSHIFKNQQTFINNTLKKAIYYTTIYAPEHFQSSKMPLVYIVNKFLNPFADNIEHWRKSIFALSCTIPIFLYFTLVKKYNDSNKYNIALISSFLFLSPYFRTSGYWGLEENFGILALIISYFFFYKLIDNKKNNISIIVLITFSSSLCVYFDQKLVIVPIICFLSIILSNNSSNLKIFTTFLYLVFSIPCFYLIHLWGSVIPFRDASIRNVGEINLENIIFCITIISFYLFPLVFFKKEKIKLTVYNFLKSKINLFFIFIFLIYLIYLFFFNEFKIPVLGGGVFAKISILLFENLLFQKIFLVFVSIISLLIILFFLNNNYHDGLILIFFIALSVIMSPIYQEYFDPLIILLALTFFKTKLLLNYKNTLIILSYYSVFLVGSNIFYL